MKTKILVGILVIAIVIFGVLFGMKLMSNEDTKETDGNVADTNSTMTVVLDDEEEETVQSKYAGNERNGV